ncbi:hypothetical protein Halru_2796 [Halovivax ruber XH-70]|uniref:Uncharacterized protein n=1 Tax=Halovivax ruber (strain DSM 18193 / JCM 13892 / XH-70) TaxID=797302 RepID=L0IHC8_HALRX|nr:hypothetical protein [Halovivax ruber]AGB17367.1 hypothetical protein Halru_2796 [Halovivax ruber XH-70]
MSVEPDRDLSSELASPKSGLQGFPVDAICTGCQRVHVKQVRPEDVGQSVNVDPVTLEAAALTSFKHVCHRCGSATWWNPTAVLSGLIETQRSAEE